MTQITYRRTHGLMQGDRIRFNGDTNRMRRTIDKVESATTFQSLLFIRPSRGWARHVRRVKAISR